VLPRPAELARLRVWIDQLPSGVRAAHPALAALAGAAAFLQGDLARAVPSLEDALRGLDGPQDFDRRWLTVRHLHPATYDHARCLPLFAELEADPAFASLPAAAQAGHHISLAYGAAFTGSWAETTRRVELSIAATTASGDPDAIEVLAQHLGPTLTGGPEMVAIVDRYASWSADRVDDGSPLARLGLHHQRAFVGLLQGRFDAAITEARAAAPLIDRLGGLPYLGSTIGWVLATVAHASGDDRATERMLRDEVDALDRGELDREVDICRLGLLARVLGRRARLDELAAVVARIEAHGASRYPGYATAAASSARAQLALAKGDPDAAIDALRDAVAIEDDVRIIPYLVLPRVDLALALDRAGRRRAALDELAAAVSSARAWGAPGLIAAAGTELVPLLGELGDDAASTAIAAIDDANAPAPVTVPATGEVLSAREVEVLRLLESGATNAQIASALFISAHTAKTHVSHILTKLAARTRGEAVARARADRLI